MVIIKHLHLIVICSLKHLLLFHYYWQKIIYLVCDNLVVVFKSYF